MMMGYIKHFLVNRYCRANLCHDSKKYILFRLNRFCQPLKKQARSGGSEGNFFLFLLPFSFSKIKKVKFYLTTVATELYPIIEIPILN